MIHFITYGDSLFSGGKRALHFQAKSCRWFDTVRSYGKEDLSLKFQSKFSKILSRGRGGGYYCWKPHIIKRRMGEINDGDFLIYLDAGCQINRKGEKRFHDYIRILDDSDYGVLSFQLNFIEKHWTTKEIFDYFNIERDSDFGNSGQYMSGAVIFKKNNHAKKIVDEWEASLIKNPLLWTDDYNHNQAKYFKENRHDQSFLSLIRKIHGSVIMKDEVDSPFWHRSGGMLKYPFWAARRK